MENPEDEKPPLPPTDNPPKPPTEPKPPKAQKSAYTAVISFRVSPDQKERWDKWINRVKNKTGLENERQIFFNPKNGLFQWLKKQWLCNFKWTQTDVIHLHAYWSLKKEIHGF